MDWVEGEGRKGCRRLLLSEVALLVCTPVDRNAKVREIIFFSNLAYLFLTDWVGSEKKGVLASLYPQ